MSSHCPPAIPPCPRVPSEVPAFCPCRKRQNNTAVQYLAALSKSQMPSTMLNKTQPFITQLKRQQRQGAESQLVSSWTRCCTNVLTSLLIAVREKNLKNWYDKSICALLFPLNSLPFFKRVLSPFPFSLLLDGFFA